MNRPGSEVRALTVNDLKHLGSATGLAGRAAWLDLAKGLAILLMVFGHIWGGLMTSQIVTPSPFNHGIYTWIYMFHMPAFAFISVSRSAIDFAASTATFTTDSPIASEVPTAP